MCPEYTEFAEGEGFERLRLPQRLSSATAGIAAPARNSLTSLQFKSLSGEFAEGEGFEPPCPVRNGGFQVHCLTVRLTLQTYLLSTTSVVFLFFDFPSGVQIVSIIFPLGAFSTRNSTASFL